MVVAAAGNGYPDVSDAYPANCTGVIAVAATNAVGSLAFYSNYGSKVSISAPGGEQSNADDPNGILSTSNTGTTVPVSDTYAYDQGTSFSANQVSGVVSLMFSVNPSLTPAQVLNILQSTARPFPSGSNCLNTYLNKCGSGIVDAAAAVTAASIAPIATTDLATSIMGTSAMLNGTVNANNANTIVTFQYGLTTSYGSSVTASESPISNGTGTAVSAIISGLSPYTIYHYRVVAVNAGGTSYGLDTTFTTLALIYLPLIIYNAGG